MRKKNMRTTILLGMLLFQFVCSGQTLQEYLKEAAANNPELQAMKYQIQGEEEKIKEVGSLPETSVGAGYFMSEPETRTGAQKAKLSVQQKIPWFGTNASKRKTQQTKSEMTKSKYEVLKRKIFLQIEQKYYQVYGLKATLKVLEQREKILDTYKELGLVAVENNKASTVDILRINIAKNGILNSKEVIKGAILSAESAFNQLLHRDGFDPLHIVDNLFIPEEEPTMMLDDITYHPELITYDYYQEVLENQLITNKREAMPDIGVGVDYIVVEERPDMNFSDNGKDIVMPMVTFSFPLFSKKYSSRSKQIDLEKEAVAQKREATQNVLEKIMDTAINDRITARINYTTYQKNIDEALLAEEIIRKTYETGTIDFEEVLEIQELILEFEKKKIEAIQAYYSHSAILNYLRQ
ncbi:TolC family protein [Aquimarina hainanensis]|uniref:TolC family protein n=1 Tax=Aquimarina hainanensis TaxID=1578017 RepID=A0ABW5N3D5_9FLAO|nr:TolC family protein [Aquimarina sp. TRL1]QKX04249.1 TolC family protein [Aquimarina sp. TRL1]